MFHRNICFCIVDEIVDHDGSRLLTIDFEILAKVLRKKKREEERENGPSIGNFNFGARFFSFFILLRAFKN